MHRTLIYVNTDPLDETPPSKVHLKAGSFASTRKLTYYVLTICLLYAYYVMTISRSCDHIVHSL